MTQPAFLPPLGLSALFHSYLVHILEWNLTSSVHLFTPCHVLGSNAPPGLGGEGDEGSQIAW